MSYIARLSVLDRFNCDVLHEGTVPHPTVRVAVFAPLGHVQAVETAHRHAEADTHVLSFRLTEPFPVGRQAPEVPIYLYRLESYGTFVQALTVHARHLCGWPVGPEAPALLERAAPAAQQPLPPAPRPWGPGPAWGGYTTGDRVETPQGTPTPVDFDEPAPEGEEADLDGMTFDDIGRWLEEQEQYRSRQRP